MGYFIRRRKSRKSRKSRTNNIQTKKRKSRTLINKKKHNSRKKLRRGGMSGKNQRARAKIRPVDSHGQPVVTEYGNIQPVDQYGDVVYNSERTITPPTMFRHTNIYSHDPSPLHERKKSKKITSSSRHGGRKKRQKTKKRCGLQKPHRYFGKVLESKYWLL